jgi:hypothetical protein
MFNVIVDMLLGSCDVQGGRWICFNRDGGAVGSVYLDI